MMNKKGFEFSFGWIFSLILGAAILFLAIYAASQIIGNETDIQNAESGKQLGIILSPTENSIEDGRITPILFPTEYVVTNKCFAGGTKEEDKEFGYVSLGVRESESIGQSSGNKIVESAFHNKYIFSKSSITGKKMYALSKSFSFPYDIASLIYLIPEDEYYCFVDAPSEIEEEIVGFRLKNLNVSENANECRKNSIKVCFATGGCEIDINLVSKSVRKDKKTVYYEDDENNALLYGAILSEPGIYECELKRIMMRSSKLANLYADKSRSLSPRGCSSGLEGDLGNYANLTAVFNSSLDMRELRVYSDEIGRRNDILSCKLF